MMLNGNTTQEMKDIFTKHINIPIITNIESYLGLATHIGQSTIQVFNYLMDKIRKKLKGWKSHILSYAGRATLVKSVSQAIPTYITTSFLIPNTIYHKDGEHNM